MPILFHVARHRALPPVYSGEGFAAFYCAGAAVRERRDPYATQPLQACETRTGAVPGGVAEPAPLPPVTLALFAWLAGLSYRVAGIVWLGVVVASFAATALALVRIAPRVPPVAIWTALAPGLLVLDGFYGETPPLAAAGLVLAAYALKLGRSRGAVAGVTLATLFEPHIGGAAWLALFFAVPRTRVPLAASAAVLGLLGMVFAGFGTTVEYVAAVLPAHARSEFPANDQYSLTSLLFQLGVPGGAALAAGAASYVVMLAIGCAGAPRIARRFTSPEMLVLFPAAAVLVGGTFVHDLQMALAVPLAVLVADGSTRAARPLAFACLLVGAVPEPWSALPVLSFGAGAAFAAAWCAPGASATGRAPWQRSREAAGIAGAAAYALFALAVHRLGSVPLGFHDGASSPLPGNASGLAEAGWSAYVRSVSHPATAGELLAKLAVTGLLVAILVSAARLRRAGFPSGANPDGAGASRA